MTMTYYLDDEDPFIETPISDNNILDKMFIGAIPFGDPESINRELKQFWILPSSKTTLRESAIRHMFETNDFGLLIPYATERLKDMIESYVPKYFCTFINTEVHDCCLLYT